MEDGCMKIKLTLFTRALVFLLSGVLLTASCHAADSKLEKQTKEAPFAHAFKGRALFEEKCKTVAGEKIYRTVESVEGVLLMKVRPRVSEKEWRDPMWPGAAFALEAYADSYITTFLGYEHSSSAKGKPVTPQYRGYIGTRYQPENPSNLPGYRFVEVIDEKDGKRYRYTGSIKDVEVKSSILVGGDGKTHLVNQYVLDKSPVLTTPPPRYGVTYEDHVVPEERAMGVASSTVKVIDLLTNEVMGELTRYAWSPGGPSGANPSPWLTADKCPGHAVGSDAATRKFVDQILIPRKEK
jgi:hypothetical protein